jgi:hypothetical protein
VTRGSALLLLAGFSFLSPEPSPVAAPQCVWVAEGDSLHVTTRTLIYVQPACGTPPTWSGSKLLTREEMSWMMACEKQKQAFYRQMRRLSAGLERGGVTVVACPAHVHVGVEGADGGVQSVQLGDGIEFLGNFLLAPGQSPRSIPGRDDDEAVLRHVKEYFR